MYSEDEPEQKATAFLDLSVPTASSSRPCLVVVAGPRSVGRIFRLTERTSRIGRSIASEIFLDEEGVSRSHAVAHLLPDGSVRIDDAGSRNGVVFRGTKQSTVILRDGDRVELGDAALALLHIDDIDETARTRSLEAATVDEDTRLFTGRHFRDVVKREIASARRSGAPFCVTLFAIDRYRVLVDEHGKANAARVLRRLGGVLRSVLQRDDIMVSRYSDAEIAVMLPDTDLDDGRTTAEWLVRAISASPVPVGDATIGVTLSAGVAMLRSGADVMSFFDTLEQALCAAKVAGGNRVEVRST
jgi:two-component system, cell cycle response regulator